MLIQIGVFSIEFVSFNYTKSKEIDSSRASQSIITGVNYLRIICNNCSNKWQSNSFGKDKFKTWIGGISAACPCCGASENIELTKLIKFNN